jgi:hypothetical protein
MVQLYLSLIAAGLRTVEQVPALWRAGVAAALEQTRQAAATEE